jgi:nucleosome binding factor SPN SPT16 subunit
LHLVDTVRVGPDKATFLTDGVKSSKETLFFLNTAEEEGEKPSKTTKAPPTKPVVNGSPVKTKTVGGKVLRNKTRSAAQEEVLQTTTARIKEHQADLHGGLQAAGLAKYSEEGGELGEKEGKGWKRFQSYKGEGALPKEVETLRVSDRTCDILWTFMLRRFKDIRRSQSSNDHFAYARVRSALPYQHY